MGIGPNQRQNEEESKIDEVPPLELLFSMGNRIGQDQRQKPQGPHVEEIPLSKLLLAHHALYYILKNTHEIKCKNVIPEELAKRD